MQGQARVSAGVACEFQLPASVLRDRPPQYEVVRRNAWAAGVPRPRRLPKDDIPVCCCLPDRLAAGAAVAAAFAPPEEVALASCDNRQHPLDDESPRDCRCVTRRC